MKKGRWKHQLDKCPPDSIVPEHSLANFLAMCDRERTDF